MKNKLNIILVLAGLANAWGAIYGPIMWLRGVNIVVVVMILGVLIVEAKTNDTN